jgi:hypothetical protein
MTDNVIYISCEIPMSAQLLAAAQDRSLSFDDAMLDVLEAAERERLGLDLYGPTRDDYNRIMAPIWWREHILQQLEWVMPGRKPGVFIRASKGPTCRTS